jgi:hypothetical protein
MKMNDRNAARFGTDLPLSAKVPSTCQRPVVTRHALRLLREFIFTPRVRLTPAMAEYMKLIDDRGLILHLQCRVCVPFHCWLSFSQRWP